MDSLYPIADAAGLEIQALAALNAFNKLGSGGPLDRESAEWRAWCALDGALRDLPLMARGEKLPVDRARAALDAATEVCA